MKIKTKFWSLLLHSIRQLRHMEDMDSSLGQNFDHSSCCLPSYLNRKYVQFNVYNIYMHERTYRCYYCYRKLSLTLSMYDETRMWKKWNDDRCWLFFLLKWIGHERIEGKKERRRRRGKFSYCLENDRLAKCFLLVGIRRETADEGGESRWFQRQIFYLNWTYKKVNGCLAHVHIIGAFNHW